MTIGLWLTLLLAFSLALWAALASAAYFGFFLIL
jgi:hypothetical protein